MPQKERVINISLDTHSFCGPQYDFNSPHFKNQIEIKELIKQGFVNLGFYTCDVEGEIDEIRVSSINPEDVSVIQVNDGNILSKGTITPM